MIFFLSKRIIIWDFILFNCVYESLATKGCITILKEPRTKVCICTNYESGFTKIPEKFPDFVAELTIENQKINTLDSSQLRNLPYLTNFTFNNNKLSRIVPQSFKYVTQIVSLRLSNNNLLLKESSLPRASLIHLKRLKVLDLSRNPLGYVPDFYFQSLEKLNVLNLSGATKGFFIERMGFFGMPNLQVLDLSYTHLTTLPEALSKQFSSMQLQEFYLYKNPWNCDCNLQWLKMWFTGHKSMKFSKDTLKDPGQDNNTDWQPRCSQPETIRGRTILGSGSIGNFDFKCPPQIFTKDRTLEMVRGGNVTLTCDMHSNPGGSVVWSKNGLVVQDHWPRVRWGVSQGAKFRAWLTVVELEEADNGDWRCILTNSVGKVSATFAVKILTPVSDLDLKYVLMYIGIGAVTIVLLMVGIGIIVYCLYGFQDPAGRRRPRARKTGDLDKVNLSNDLDGGQTYRIISRPSQSDPSSDNPLLNGRYFSPTAIQPCIDDSPSPFSHYLLNNGSLSPTSLCPLHGDIANKTSGTEADRHPTHNHSVPCPIHGDVLSYLAPVSTAVSTGPFNTKTVLSKSPDDYVVRVSSCNPPGPFVEDVTYLSSGPDSLSYSFSAAI